jgi:hypothetical protein
MKQINTIRIWSIALKPAACIVFIARADSYADVMLGQTFNPHYRFWLGIACVIAGFVLSPQRKNTVTAHVAALVAVIMLAVLWTSYISAGRFSFSIGSFNILLNRISPMPFMFVSGHALHGAIRAVVAYRRRVD